jgi:hypothetical protein
MYVMISVTTEKSGCAIRRLHNVGISRQCFNPWDPQSEEELWPGPSKSSVRNRTTSMR